MLDAGHIVERGGEHAGDGDDDIDGAGRSGRQVPGGAAGRWCWRLLLLGSRLATCCTGTTGKVFVVVASSSAAAAGDAAAATRNGSSMRRQRWGFQCSQGSPASLAGPDWITPSLSCVRTSFSSPRQTDISLPRNPTLLWVSKTTKEHKFKKGQAGRPCASLLQDVSCSHSHKNQDTNQFQVINQRNCPCVLGQSLDVSMKM